MGNKNVRINNNWLDLFVYDKIKKEYLKWRKLVRTNDDCQNGETKWESMILLQMTWAIFIGLVTKQFLMHRYRTGYWQSVTETISCILKFYHLLRLILGSWYFKRPPRSSLSLDYEKWRGWFKKRNIKEEPVQKLRNKCLYTEKTEKQ